MEFIQFLLSSGKQNILQKNCSRVTIYHVLLPVEFHVTAYTVIRDILFLYCFILPQKNPKSNAATQTRHQNCDYTKTADRLRKVSLGNDSLQTGVVKPVYGIPTWGPTANQSGEVMIMWYTNKFSYIILY